MRFSPQESTKTETNYQKLRTQGFNHAFSRTNQRSDQQKNLKDLPSVGTLQYQQKLKKAEKPNAQTLQARWKPQDGTRTARTLEKQHGKTSTKRKKPNQATMIARKMAAPRRARFPHRIPRRPERPPSSLVSTRSRNRTNEENTDARAQPGRPPAI